MNLFFQEFILQFNSNILVLNMVATLKTKMSELYQTSLSLWKVEKVKNLLLIKLKYLAKIRSL